MEIQKDIQKYLTNIAHLFKRLGEEQKKWEQEQIGWKKGVPPFDDLFFYVALAAAWQAFSRRIKGEERRNFIKDVYRKFLDIISGKSEVESIRDVLQHHRCSRFMVGVNLIKLWSRIAKEIKERQISKTDPISVQKIATECASRSQHWIAYAPIEAAAIVGEIFPVYPELIPPLGGPVMNTFSFLGLPFSYPPTIRELRIIHEFLLHLSSLVRCNHLLLEMGIWRFGWNLKNQP